VAIQQPCDQNRYKAILQGGFFFPSVPPLDKLYMDKNPAELDVSPVEEEKQAAVERALELEQLEDREFQGTYRND